MGKIQKLLNCLMVRTVVLLQREYPLSSFRKPLASLPPVSTQVLLGILLPLLVLVHLFSVHNRIFLYGFHYFLALDFSPTYKSSLDIY